MLKRIKAIRKELHKRFLEWLGIPFISSDARQEDREVYYQKLMQRFTRKMLWQISLILPLCTLVLWEGIRIGKSSNSQDDHAVQSSQTNTGTSVSKEYWSCSMHPNIKLGSQGKCPVCFMDLILVKVGDNNFSLTATGKKLAEVETAPALYRQVTSTVRMVGKVDYDETRIANITLWTPGRSRVHKMLVNFTGAMVKKGEPLVEIYSPDLIATQGEYLSAYQSWQSRKNSALNSNMRASRRKLLDLGMTAQQVKDLEQTGQPDEMITIHSPVSGTVIAKLTNEGEWHNRGMSLYQIADLAKVWVRLAAYEADLSCIRYAQQVKFEAEAYPGKHFSGRIAFIDPFMDETTRTVKVRVNANNVHSRLKPGMFVRAQVKAQIGEDGEVWEPSLKGKWVCPVHPEVIRDQPGECGEVLSLDQKIRCPKWLVLASPASQTMLRSRVLTIPCSAPLMTGKRAIVYVEGDNFQYITRDVLLGPRAGNYYVVLSGIEEGEQVVTRGAFKIDSALQIKAKPSMMNPEGEQEKHKQRKKLPTPPFAVAGADYHRYLQPMLEAYFDLVEDLGSDQIDRVGEYLRRIRHALDKIALENFELADPSRKQLQKNLHDLRQALEIFSRTDVERFRLALKKIAIEKMGFSESESTKLQKDLQDLRQVLEKFVSTDIKVVRKNLLLFSQRLTIYLENFGHELSFPIYKMYCPMVANNKGAHWWQRHPQLKNAYFGSQMLRCGDVQKKLMPLKKGEKGHLTEVTIANVDLGNTYRVLFPKFIKNYLLLGDALTKNKLQGILELRKKMLNILEQTYTRITHLKGKPLNIFRKQLFYIKQMLVEMHGNDIKKIRRDYFSISEGLARFIKTFGHPYPYALYLMHCPMYRHNLGGSWFQEQRAPLCNPYYGKDSTMYKCGELIETVPPLPDRQKEDTDGDK